MNIQDLLQVSFTQIQTLQNTPQTASTNSSNTSQFSTALGTALTAINTALQTLSAEQPAVAAALLSTPVSSSITSQSVAPTENSTSAATFTPDTTTAAADTSTPLVPQKGANGYYNTDPKPSDPVAPTNIHSADIQEQITAYDHDQLAAVIWQQKEISIANLALRQRGLYDWQGSPLHSQAGAGDWQTEFNWRMQAMRDQGLPVDDYLATVTMG